MKLPVWPIFVFVGIFTKSKAYDVEDRAPPIREHSFSKPFQG